MSDAVNSKVFRSPTISYEEAGKEIDNLQKLRETSELLYKLELLENRGKPRWWKDEKWTYRTSRRNRWTVIKSNVQDLESRRKLDSMLINFSLSVIEFASSKNLDFCDLILNTSEYFSNNVAHFLQKGTFSEDLLSETVAFVIQLLRELDFGLHKFSSIENPEYVFN